MPSLNRATRRAARKAAKFSGSDAPIDFDAVQAQEDALRSMESPRLCPCCSFMWDHAEAEATLRVSPEAYNAWLYRTLALDVNAVGVKLGQRGHVVTLADWDT